MTTESAAAIDVQNLQFSYGGPPILSDVSFQLPHGARCLLAGSNGAGKTTLLRILAGKRLVKAPVLLLGRHAYFDSPQEVTYLGPEFMSNPIVRTDIAVKDLLRSNLELIPADKYSPASMSERCSQLVKLLDVDPEWHMHQISDGQRRRVQIVLGLLRPFRILLLDEITVDLDLLTRQRLLAYLYACTDAKLPNRCTIIYATHILDGLGTWPTHIVHMALGRVKQVADFKSFIQPFISVPSSAEDKQQNDNEQEESIHPDDILSLRDRAPVWRRVGWDSPLLCAVEKWLREDSDAAWKHELEMEKAPTKWSQMSEDTRRYGDKFYNYWN